MYSSKAREAAAAQLMALQNATPRSYATLGMTVSSGLVQLRSHERAVEGHDDVMIQLKIWVLDTLEQAFKHAAKVLVTRPAAVTTTAAKAELDTMMDSGYRQHLKEKMTAYSRSFTQSEMAVELLLRLPDLIADLVDDSLRKTQALKLACYAAVSAGAVKNTVHELVNSIAEAVGRIAELVTLESDEAFDASGPELDAVARRELKLYRECIANGHTADTALHAVSKAMQTEVAECLGRLVKHPDTDK